MGRDLLRLTTRTISRTAGRRYGEPVTERLVAALPTRLTARSESRETQAMGLRWRCDTRDNLQRTIYYSGSYDAKTVGLAKSLLTPDAVVLDVGANVGTFALPLARHLTRGQVIAFEPLPTTFDHLRQHIEMNGLAERVRPLNMALGRSSGSLTLRPSADYGHADVGTWSAHGAGVGLDVDIRIGADVVADLALSRVDLVKVDVEGAELDVLHGLSDVLDTHRPFVICEVVPHLQKRAGNAHGAIADFLASLGYRMEAIRARGLTPVPEGWGGNALFTPAVVPG